ncbi:MFS transporter [Amycolatopsis sp. NBC_00348]|uniref:MFS transporter n=1 Tax=Amycolatopsis sp. NBC_00348 TaxID=2975956 RepID=UPI002E25D2BD
MITRRLYDSYAPRTRAGRLLACAAAGDSTGSGLFLALAPVFVVTYLGVDPVRIGVVLGAANLLGLASPVLAGALADRFGADRVWSVLLLARAIGYSGFVFVSSFSAYAVLTCAVCVLDRAAPAVQQAFVVQVEAADERTRSMAVLRTVRNAGMSLGLLGSGVMIAMGAEWSFRLGFAVNALSYVGLLVVVRVLGRDLPRPAPSAGPTQRSKVDGRYVLMSIGNAVLSLHDSVLFTLIPLWLVTRTQAPPALIGPLLASNTVLTVLLQVPLSRWCAGPAAARRTVVRALAPLAGSCLLFLAAEPAGPAGAIGLAVAAVMVLTVGENMHSAAAFELSHRLAPDRAMGAYLGVFNVGNAAQLSFGPPFMTAVVLRGPLGWASLAVAFAVGGVLMVAGGRSRALVKR